MLKVIVTRRQDTWGVYSLKPGESSHIVVYKLSRFIDGRLQVDYFATRKAAQAAIKQSLSSTMTKIDRMNLKPITEAIAKALNQASRPNRREQQRHEADNRLQLEFLDT
jgi:hypothetical protein